MTQRLYFSGVVHPERAILSVSDIESILFSPDGIRKTNAKINILNNQITVSADTEEPDIFTLRNIIKSEIEFITGVASFISGCGYDIDITKAFGENLNPTQVFGVDIPVIKSRGHETRANQLINCILPLCSGANGIFLRRCLIDLSFAIKRAEDTSFYCYRAIECIRQSFGANLSDKKQWEAMGKAVNTSKKSMDFPKSHAFDARHGNHKPVTDHDRQNLYQYTWDVVEKYIDYRLKEQGSLEVFSCSQNPLEADSLV